MEYCWIWQTKKSLENETEGIKQRSYSLLSNLLFDINNITIIVDYAPNSSQAKYW